MALKWASTRCRLARSPRLLPSALPSVRYLSRDLHAFLRMSTLLRTLVERHVTPWAPGAPMKRCRTPWMACPGLHLPRRTCLSALQTRSYCRTNLSRTATNTICRTWPTTHPVSPGLRRFTTWLQRLGRPQDPQEEPTDGTEQAAKIAMLEKAMKGRQPTDLMLRCTSGDAPVHSHVR